MRTWDELSDQEQTDLAEWYNVSEIDDDDRARLASLLESGKFAAWDCPECGERVYLGQPDDWGHFQGVLQADYSSYPGDADHYTPEQIAQMCDGCRASCHTAVNRHNYDNDTGIRPGRD